MKNHDKEQKQVNIDTALEYRLAGLSYREIAKAMGVSSTTAYNYVMEAIRVIQEQYTEKAEQLVVVELNKLNKAEKALHSKILKGDVAAINTLLSIQARRAKLLGLDAPEKREDTHKFPQLEIAPYDPSKENNGN